jgi:hypothetical protein
MTGLDIDGNQGLANFLKEKPWISVQAQNLIDQITPQVNSKALSRGNSGQPRQNKYNVSPTAERTYQGVVYASKKEMKKAKELDLLVKAGEISFYLRQVPFNLGGIPSVIYRADFVTFKAFVEGEPCHESIIAWGINVIETKGFQTPDSKLKMKLFKEKYPALTLVIE